MKDEKTVIGIKGQLLGELWEVVRDTENSKEFVLCYDDAVVCQEHLSFRAESPSLRFTTIAASPALREIIAGLGLCDSCGLEFFVGDNLRVTDNNLIVHESCEAHCLDKQRVISAIKLHVTCDDDKRYLMEELGLLTQGVFRLEEQGKEKEE